MSATTLASIRVLVFHGYLLGGTGSNVYNSSLARALRELGHEVHLLCQERDPAELSFADAIGDWDEGELEVRPSGADPARGSVTVYRPEIGGLLPVFVRDRYAGFEVKTFAELTDAELEAYIERNIAAVQDVIERAGGPEAALANHLVMGPVILARAGLRYALKVHGSDLSYTVLPDLDRFGPFAAEAVAGANGILVGSGHIARRLALAAGDDVVRAKVRLGPPGVDTTAFAPVSPADREPRLRDLAGSLRGAAPGTGSWERDPGEAAAAVEWFAGGDGPRAVFVGKLIASKGVDLLLAAWPLVHAQAPHARLLVVGFGAFRAGLERLWGALAGGDLADAAEVARRGRAIEGGAEGPLRHLASFLAAPPGGYAAAAAAARDSVRFAGRLDHPEVARLVPACDALVFPSTFPEAFGMVAAEAAAAGVLPVSAAHSGALEVSRALAAGLPEAARGLVSFPVDDRSVQAIAERLTAWFSLPEADRAQARAALTATAERLWSWRGVAAAVLAASAGRLDEVPAPGS